MSDLPTPPTAPSPPPRGAAARARPSPEQVGRGVVVALWASLLLTAAPALAAALDDRARSVQIVASLGLWAAWAGALGAALVPRTVTLTAVRIVMPAAVPAAAWALWVTGPGRDDGVRVDAAAGLATAAALTVLVLAAFVGDGFVNGSSYGDERRLPLRPPAPLVFGPVPLAWAACVAGAVAGPLLLAAGSPVGGGLALVAGWAVAAATARALHGLARRWLVFVPAGFVVHDPLTLTDPVLCTRTQVRRIGPAAADTDAADFTAGALGLALQVDLASPAPAVPRARGRAGAPAEATGVDAFLVTPSRPGETLRVARSRRIATG
jgi:hypothetical protein